MNKRLKCQSDPGGPADIQKRLITNIPNADRYDDNAAIYLEYAGWATFPDGTRYIRFDCPTILHYATLPRDLVAARGVKMFKHGWDPEEKLAYFRVELPEGIGLTRNCGTAGEPEKNDAIPAAAQKSNSGRGRRGGIAN